jgi:hypothetical protein
MKTNPGLLAAAIGVVVLVVAVMLFTVQPTVARSVHGEGASIGLRETVDTTLNAYYELIKLGTLLFGAVGFFLTYQREGQRPLPDEAISPLIAALVFAAGVVAFGLLAVDRIVTMLGNNAVELSVPSLRWARLAMYSSWACALVSLALFILRLLQRGGNRGRSANTRQ